MRRVPLLLLALFAQRPVAARAADPDTAPPAASASPASDAQAAKLACIAAFDRAQRERNESHFLESQAALIQCSEPRCGDALVSECTRMYTDVENALPSVVFSAHDASRGEDRSDVAVAINGRPALQTLDGRPVNLDPGEYQLRFSAPGVDPVELRVVVRTGEKYRVIDAVFAERAPPPAPARVPAAPVVDRGGGVPVLSYVLGGLGVASLGTFVALRVIGASDYETLKQGCAPSCPDSDVSNLRLKYTLSNVALGVGAAALTGAIVLYALAPGDAVAPEAALLLLPRPGGSEFRFESHF